MTSFTVHQILCHIQNSLVLPSHCIVTLVTNPITYYYNNDTEVNCEHHMLQIDGCGSDITINIAINEKTDTVEISSFEVTKNFILSNPDLIPEIQEHMNNLIMYSGMLRNERDRENGY